MTGLNDDAWSHVLSYIFPTSITSFLALATVNSRFNILINTHPAWAILEKPLKIHPPKSSTKESWKSLVMLHRTYHCERCPTESYLPTLPLELYHPPNHMIAAVCWECHSRLQQLELNLSHLNRKFDLAAELAKYPIFDGYEIDEILRSIYERSYGAGVKDWMENIERKENAAEVAASMVPHREQAERKRSVKRWYAGYAKEDRVKWIKDGVGDIGVIVNEVREDFLTSWDV
ncbi:hypothetical protein HK097_001070 [Rhizophlyctis rosea]|uniref:F-box domain-containing protein n=1 Tax=Rhizophlyctis rosea TaxID=64517 RepID=A0AAD5S4U9_9FUNG|nr:hypothetical protein HK097_001070 [Rhizophlyctis rosea]